MNSEVFIENNRLDVSAEISSLLTFTIDDIKDFSSRNTTFSKTIVFPGTTVNSKLFGSIFDATVRNPYDAAQDNVNTNFNASVSAECLIFNDNMQVFKGILRLMEIIIVNNVPEYECSVFGELGGFILKLGNKKLTDLDFSAYDHTLNTTNIINSWDTINGSGYYYPLIDVGGVSFNKVDYDITAFRPALYYKEYIDKIFEAAGYTYESDLFETARFKSLILPFNLKTLRSAESLLMTATRTTRYKVVDNSSPTDANLKYETFTGTGWSANVDKDEFTYTDSPQLQATIFFSILGDYQIISSDRSVNMTIQKNGVEIPGYSKLLMGGSTSSLPYVWQFTFDITLNQNDIITFHYDGQSSVFNADAFATDCLFQVTSAVPIYAPAGDGDDIEMSQVIPQNILQKDLIASIIRLFNLYLYEDTKTKNIVIKPFVDFYNLTPDGFIDWTYKMDRSKAIRLKPMSELNSRYYNFTFKSDNDYYNELYRKRYNENFGDRIYDSEFEFANEKTDIALIFSPSVLVGYAGVDKIVTAMYKLNAGVEERTDVNIRIMQAKKITGVTSWSIKDGVSTLTSTTDYGYAGNYDDPDAPANDIHFGVPRELFFTLATGAINVTQFNVYWSSYMAEITDKDSKLLTATFKLTNKDIYDLDFAKPIYLDGSIWRLNKIEDWNASDPDVCKCEMLKIINLIY